MRPLFLCMLAALLVACSAPTATVPPTPTTAPTIESSPTPFDAAPPTLTPGTPASTAVPTPLPTAPVPSPTTVASAAPRATLGYGQPHSAALLAGAETLVVGTSAGLVLLRTPDLVTLRFVPLEAAARELAASPDGRLLAASSYDGPTATTRLLAPDGAQLFSVPGRAAFFSADGSLLGVADLDNSTGRYTTRLYSVADGTERAAVPGDRAVLSPDASLISSFDREQLIVSDVGGGELFGGERFAAAFSPDGMALAVAGFAGVELLRLDNGQLLPGAPRTLTPNLALDLVFDADGALLAMTETGLLRWDLQAGGEPTSLPIELGAAMASFGPQGRLLALDALVGDAPNELRLLRADDGRELYADGEFEGGRASFSADGRQAAVVTAAGSVRLVDADQGLLGERAFAGYELVAVASDGRVAAGRFGPQVDFWAPEGGEDPTERLGSFGLMERLRQLSTDGIAAVAEVEQQAFGGFVSQLSAVLLGPAESGGGEPIAVVSGLNLPLPAIWDYAGRRFAWLDANGSVQLSDGGDPRPLPALAGVPEGATVTSLALSPNGAQLAVGYADGTLLIADTANFTPLASGPLGAGEALTALAWSGDGRFLAMALAGGDLLAWEAIDDDNPVRFAGAPGAGIAPALAWDADGGRLAVGAADGLAVYDRSSGAELLRLPLPATGVALSADGARLAAVVRGQLLVVDVP